MERGRAIMLGAGILVALCLGGCSDLQLSYEQGAESLLDFRTGPNYQQASLRARNPYDANARYQGTLTLANAPFASEEAYLDLFEQNLTDRDASVQMAAVRGLANHGGPEHAPLLADALDNEADIVRIEAARGLQRLHNPATISALVRHSRISEEQDDAVRAECAHALGQYAEPRVLSSLIMIIRDDSSLAAVSSAIEALRSLTGKDFGLKSEKWTAWADATQAPFEGQTVYIYRRFHRDRRLFEHLPLMGNPPNEVEASPAGLVTGG